MVSPGPDVRAEARSGAGIETVLTLGVLSSEIARDDIKAFEKAIVLDIRTQSEARGAHINTQHQAPNWYKSLLRRIGPADFNSHDFGIEAKAYFLHMLVLIGPT